MPFESNRIRLNLEPWIRRSEDGWNPESFRLIRSKAPLVSNFPKRSPLLSQLCENTEIKQINLSILEKKMTYVCCIWYCISYSYLWYWCILYMILFMTYCDGFSSLPQNHELIDEQTIRAIDPNLYWGPQYQSI